MRGERTGKRYQLTDRVSVQVVRVDLESRKIDLRLAGADAFDGAADASGKSGKSNKGNAPSMVKPGPKTQSRFDAKAGEGSRSGKSRHGGAHAASGAGSGKPVSKSGKKKR